VVGFDLLGIISAWDRNLLGFLCQLAQAQRALLIHDPPQTRQKALFNGLWLPTFFKLCYVHRKLVSLKE